MPGASKKTSARLLFAVALAALTLGAGTAQAAIVFDGSPGTSAPPATLGPYAMTAFGLDPQPRGSLVSSVVDPAGTVSFSMPLTHLRVSEIPPYNVDWGTWSNGYTGDVYCTGCDPVGPFNGSITLALPANTVAFYLYAEPDAGDFNITATGQDGTTSGPLPVQAEGGAQYFGFYATDGSTISTITVTSSTLFAVGEFGIASLPTSNAQCMHGWQSYGIFKNRGDCVSYVATGGKNQPAGSAK